MIEALKDIVRPILRPPLHKRDVRLAYRVHGTRYGAWPLLLRERDPIVLSFGVGEDISFDLEAIKLGLQVHAFDPTPKCNAWIQAQNLPDAFHFHPYGNAPEDGTATFHPPADPNHVSYSAQPAEDQKGEPVVVPVFRLQTILDQLGLVRIDTMKMDIEGFEYAVIDDMIASGLMPTELLIEFHHSMYGYDNAKTNHAVSALKAVGYKLYYVSSSGQEYAFYRERLAISSAEIGVRRRPE